jgi:putative DNA primase/helicase
VSGDTPAGQPGTLGPLEYADDIRDVPGWELTEAQEARRAELEAAALEYGRAGFEVIPLWHVDEHGQCCCPKSFECTRAGKHPREEGWQKRATTDPSWWRELAEGEINPVSWFPQANIGIALDDTFALDMDPDNGGDTTLEQIQERLGKGYEMPETVIVQTGSGGRHFWFLQPEGKPVGNPKFRRGLDLKGRGGYLVAPPSVSGKGRYAFIDKHDLMPAPAAAWLLDAIAEGEKQQRGEPSRLSSGVIPTGRIRAYRKAALERNARELAEAPSGDRNNTLNRCAFALGQLAPAGITNEDECREVLYEAAARCGMRFAGDGVEATFNSGWRSGMTEPWWPDWAEEDEEYPIRTWDGFGLGDRLVDRYAETLRWAPAAGRWMSWQSGRWEMDDKQAGEWMARPMIESMADEADQYSDEPTINEDGEREESPRAKFLKWVRTCRNPAAMNAAAAVARANPLMRIDLEKCDSSPMWVNTRNGVYDAVTREFHEHVPIQLLTMRAAVSYDPGATCPGWDVFFEQVQPDPEMREFLYRIWGYSLTGDASEQCVFLNHGSGANGKSVTQDVLSMIAGDYGQVVPIETLLTSRNKQGRIPNDVARMRGKRFLKCSETAEGRRLDEALIKQLTGGEEVVARFMRSEYFQFRMQGKVHLTSNSLVHIGDEDSTWRRVHLIPWTVTIPPDKQDRYLARRLYDEEAPGIFNRLLAGLADWRARGGLMPPQAAREAVDAYRWKEDTLGQAIAELFTLDMTHAECTARCPADHLIARSGEYLFEEYKRWAGPEGMGRTTFYAKLEDRGFIRGEHKKKTMFPQLQGSLMGH